MYRLSDCPQEKKATFQSTLCEWPESPDRFVTYRAAQRHCKTKHGLPSRIIPQVPQEYMTSLRRRETTRLCNRRLLAKKKVGPISDRKDYHMDKDKEMFAPC